MCEGRRSFLARGAAFLSVAAEAELLEGGPQAGTKTAGPVDLVAPDVYFHAGTLSDDADAVCNNGWIVFEDYVLVVDANFPAGARQIIGQIRALTDKPIGSPSTRTTTATTPTGTRSSWRTARSRSPTPA